MTIKLYQVDAFTEQPFQGNPAAVCLLPEPAEKTWMSNLAMEMNLSETAFLVQEGEEFNLRWFTPAVEVELCGHATLASAHILYETGCLSPNQKARFQTASGVLTAVKRDDLIELNFPATPPKKVSEPAGLSLALGVVPEYVGKSRYDFLIKVGTEKEVRQAKPDFLALEELGVRGVMLTSPSESDEFDFISRFFAPGAGIDEDPVTGSAHCCLGPYWGGILGKDQLIAYQASDRGGIIHVRLGEKRIHLSGKAVTIFEADLVI
jgi:PhzF family phenazine biosynthesis protein